MEPAKAMEVSRASLGLPKSNIRIPTESDPESAHRAFFAQNTVAKKIKEDVRNGYIVRVEERHAVDLNHELCAGSPLTEEEAQWEKRKQARRAGPPSSSWPSAITTENKPTEYIRFIEKAHNLASKAITLD